MHVVYVFPGEQKKNKKGARNTLIFQIDPDVEMNAIIWHGKGVVIADVRFYRLFAIVWQSGYFQLVNEKFGFLLCKYSRC
jgi:hypothetical protein